MGVKNPYPTTPTLQEEQESAFAAISGRSTLAGYDLKNLDPLEVLTREGRQKLKRAGYDTSEPVSLKTLQEEGIEGGKNFQQRFARALKVEGLIRKDGQLADTSVINSFLGEFDPDSVQGQLQDTRSEVLDLIKGSVDIAKQGMSILSGDFSDPLSQSLIKSINEQFNTNLATQGFSSAGSGQVAFDSTVAGIYALNDLGGRLLGTGVGTAEHLDPFFNPTGVLDRADLRFDRNLFARMFEYERNQAHRARQFAKEQAQLNRISSTTTLGLASPGGADSSGGQTSVLGKIVGGIGGLFRNNGGGGSQTYSAGAGGSSPADPNYAY